VIAFTLKRLREDKNKLSTLGALFDEEGRQLCWTLEPGWHENKRQVSRIPAGVYRLTVRKFGGWHERLSKRFPDMHQGAIELADVPGRSAILIHPFNWHTQTLGCIGPGKEKGFGADGAHAIFQSNDAYVEIHPGLLAAALKGESIEIANEPSRVLTGTVT
jgi:hypothetical protein